MLISVSLSLEPEKQARPLLELRVSLNEEMEETGVGKLKFVLYMVFSISFLYILATLRSNRVYFYIKVIIHNSGWSFLTPMGHNASC